jgi:hypothetical protein
MAVISQLAGGGFDGGVNDLPCELYNYHIGQPQIVKTTNRLVLPNSNLGGFDFNASVKDTYPDHAKILGNQCYLIAPIYECCWVRPNPAGPLLSNGASLKGWVLLSKSRAVISYEECQDSTGKIGKRPVIIQYFPYEEVVNGPLEPIAGPSNPTRTVSLILQRVGRDGVARNISWTSTNNDGIFWGNCYGDFSISDFRTWFEQNNIIPNYVDLSRYRTAGTSPNGGYVLTDPSTGPLRAGEIGYVIEGDSCKYSGDCVVTDEPPPPGPPPSIECITSTTVTPSTPQLWLQYAREHFGTIPFINTPLVDSNRITALISRTDGEEKQVSLLNDGAQINLDSYGFPCQTGQVARFQRVSYTTYPEFTFCILNNNTTRLVFTGRIITDTSNPIYDGTVVDRPIGVRNFDPNCCERLSNAYLTGNSNELSALSSIGLRVQQIQRTKRFELVDSCGCEEIEIVDLGCFFNNMNYSTILKADIKDQRTHTGIRREVVDERCKTTDGPEVYHPFDRKRDIISNRVKSGTTGLFNGDDMMECYYTSSTRPTASNQYYYEVSDCETCGKIPYFAVTYGHISGSGSVFIQGENSNKTPTDSIYSQYQLICLEPTRSASSGISVPRFEFVSASSMFM